MGEITIPDRLLKPFYKVHVSDLISSEKCGEGQWSVKAVGGEGQRLTCSMVWLQAEVVRLSLAENWVEVEEGGSQVRVVGVSSSPGGVDWIQQGQFVQVLGQLNSSTNNKVVCTKIIHLDNKKLSRANSKQLWDLEVSELHKALAKKIKFRDN